MTLNHYQYTHERLNKLIYILITHEGDIKRRLIESLIWWTSENSFPEHLRPLFRDIEKVINTKPPDEYHNSFKRSLQNKRLKTCSDVANKIVTLEIMLNQYIKHYDE